MSPLQERCVTLASLRAELRLTHVRQGSERCFKSGSVSNFWSITRLTPRQMCNLCWSHKTAQFLCLKCPFLEVQNAGLAPWLPIIFLVWTKPLFMPSLCLDCVRRAGCAAAAQSPDLLIFHMEREQTPCSLPKGMSSPHLTSCAESPYLPGRPGFDSLSCASFKSKYGNAELKCLWYVDKVALYGFWNCSFFSREMSSSNQAWTPNGDSNMTLFCTNRHSTVTYDSMMITL